MKKILIILISFIVAFVMIFMVAGCKKEDIEDKVATTETAADTAEGTVAEETEAEETASKETVTISMSVWGAPWEDVLCTDILIPEFEKEHPNIKVEYNNIEEYWTKIMTLYAGGEAPDVMRNEQFYMGLNLNAGMLMPLDDFINGPNGIDMSQYVDGIYDAFSYLDDTYFIPVGINNANFLYYNMDLFDAAGLEYPTTDWTLQDLEEAAKALTTDEVSGFFWGQSHLLLYTLALGTGATVWGGDSKDEFLYSDELVETIEIMQKWIWDDKITPPELDSKAVNESAALLFASGKLAMYSDGGWIIPTIKVNAPDLNFGTTTFPIMEAKGPGGIAGGTNWTMNNQTEHPEEAWELIKFLTSTESILKYWQQTYVETPANKLVLDNPDFTNITGVEGAVPPITDAEEFERLLGVHKKVLEGALFSNEMIGPYNAIAIQFMAPLFDQTTAGTRGDAAAAVKATVDSINETIQASK